MTEGMTITCTKGITAMYAYVLLLHHPNTLLTCASRVGADNGTLLVRRLGRGLDTSHNHDQPLAKPPEVITVSAGSAVGPSLVCDFKVIKVFSTKQ